MIHATWSPNSTTARALELPSQTQLTPQAVKSGKFVRRLQWQVEGQILTQALYMRNVPVGQDRKNLVFVATAANLLYAFDADAKDATAGPVFQIRLGAAATHAGPPQLSPDL